jgi:alcohol dehydrogenase class IV
LLKNLIFLRILLLATKLNPSVLCRFTENTALLDFIVIASILKISKNINAKESTMMNPIHYNLPTKIFMEKNCVQNHSEIFPQLGHKAMLVTGRHSAKANGSQNDILEILKKHHIDYTLFDEIDSNPDIEIVYKGAKKARAEHVEFIIAIGGGSPMDAGKAIALLARQDIAEADLFTASYTSDVLPMVHIPTTAGTGSEVTQYAILSNPRAQTKTSIATSVLFPNYALLDPSYMLDLPREITIHTALDALSHLIEASLSKKNNDLNNALALEGINAICPALSALQNNSPLSSKDRESLSYASLLGGIVIAHAGTNIVHALGYSLTYFRHIDHGRANALLLHRYLEFIETSAPQKVRVILNALELTNLDAFRALMDSLLGEKESFTLDELEKYTKIALQAKNTSNSIASPDENIVLQLYKQSLL